MKRFKAILCVLEPGEETSSALERAAAAAENNQADLTLISVVEEIADGEGVLEGGPSPAELQAATVKAHEQRLADLAEAYRGRVAIQTRVLTGTPFLEVIREVLRNGHDLVIKTAEQPQRLARLFGSDDMHLLRKCPCPVWLLKPGAPERYQRILAAVDLDESYPDHALASGRALSQEILTLAGSMAVSEFAELHVAHAWRPPGEDVMRSAFLSESEDRIAAYVEQVRRQREASMDRLMRQMAAELGQDAMDYLKPRRHLVKGWVRDEIPALAHRIQADLVVMGTVGRTGIRGFIMGNTAEAILNELDCSVLAVKPPGFATPVALQA